MTEAEYVVLAGKIAAAYPSAFISDATLEDWAERLAEVELDHAARMTNRLRNLSAPPDPWDWQIARRDTREVEYYRALPAGTKRATPDDLTPEERERYEAVKALLREKPPLRPYPKYLDDIPDDQLKPSFILRRDMLCAGTGEIPVIINGVACCPGCNEPLPQEPSESAAMMRENRKSRR